MIDNKNWGILYFLMIKPTDTKERTLRVHGDMLMRSMKSLKKHMPDVDTILFTNIGDFDWGNIGLSKVVYKDEPKDVWTYKYECMLSTPFERTVHIDCDTYICQPFYDVFEMLNEVDFAVPLSPWYFGKRQFHVPRAFPEPAGGFIAYNTNRRTFEMLEETKRLVINRSGGCDEPYLRVALYESKIKFSILPWEYNCVFLLPGYLMSKPVILHGKLRDIETVERCLSSPGPKLFTGEKVIYCDRVNRKRYEMGMVEDCGHRTRSRK